MSENKYNELDKLFRSRLKGNAKSASEGWNEPPADLLDNAIAQLPPEDKGKRRVFFFWFLGGLLILGLSLVSLYNHRTITDLNKQLAELTIEKKAILESDNTFKSQTKISEKAVDEPLKKETQKRKQRKSPTINETKIDVPALAAYIPIEKVSREKNQISANSNLIAGSDFLVPTQSIFQTSSNPSGISKSLILIGEMANKSEKVQPRESLSEIAFLAVETPKTLALNEKHLRISSDISIDKEDSFDKSIMIFATAGQKLSTTCMTNTEGFDFDLTGYDQRYSGFSSGLGASVRLSSKFGLQSSLSYYGVNNESLFADEFHYDKNKEIEDVNGNLSYRSSLNVQSILGQFSSDMAMEVGSNEIAHNEVMNNHTHIDQHFNVLNWSIGLDYYLLDLGKFQVVAQTGIGVNHVFSADQEMHMDIYLDKEHMTSGSFMSSDMTSVNRYFLSVNLGLDLRFKLSEKISIMAGSGIERSINPINKNQASSQTYLRSINTALRLGYNF